MVRGAAKKADNGFARPQAKSAGKSKKRSRTTSQTSSVASDDVNDTPVLGLKKPKKRDAYNPKEEARLEKLVFDDPNDIFQNLKDGSESEVADESESIVLPEKTSVADDNAADKNDALDSDDEDEDDSSLVMMKSDEESIITVDSKVTSKAPAWEDEDDQNLSVKDALIQQNRRLPGGRPEKKYSELLYNKYAHIVGTPKWAKLDREKDHESGDSDDEVLKHSNHIVPKKIKSLPKGNIDIKVLTQINKQTHIEGPFVNSVQFHEQSTVALVAGSSGVLSLFEIDGRENNKLHSMKFAKFPIYTARFLKSGSEILVGSKSWDHCHSYDLISGKTLRIPLPHGITNMKKFEISPDGKIIAICGRLGEIHLLTSNTKELIGTVQMNKKCQTLAFSPDSTKLLTHGEGSEIYVWDLASRTCLNRAFDDGCIASCSIAVSPNNQFVATGSKQGAVNIYETRSILEEKTPQPVKTILNLVTSITKLKFNPASEILAIASEKKANAFKMIHLPSFQVFSNFPTFNTTMFNPLDIDFSPASGYISVTNNRGFAYLYRLKHYGNY